MGKKSRRIRHKEPTEYKTKSDRLIEYNDIKQHFLNIGFKSDDEGIRDILSIVNRFYETGESWSGKKDIPHTRYKVNIILTNNKHKQNLIKLEFDS